MPGNVACPRCGQVYTVQPAMAGRPIQCVRCGQVFQDAAPAYAEPAPNLYAQSAGPAQETEPLSDADKAMLGLGSALSTISVICLVAVFPILEVTHIGALLLTLLLGLAGGVLILAALRNQLALGGGIAGAVAALAIVGFVMGAVHRREPPVAQETKPTGLAASMTQPATQPTAAQPAAQPASSPAAVPTTATVEMAKTSNSMEIKPPAAITPSPMAVASETKTAETAPAVSQPPAGEVPSPSPTSAGSGTMTNPAAGNLPPPIAAALDSVVLIEHPLASGSGFAVAKNLVVTNAHVVEGAFPDEIKVQFGGENNPSQKISRMVYYDRPRDLAVLELDAELKPLVVVDGYQWRPGEEVVLMGNPSVPGGMLMRNATNHGRLSSRVRIEGQDFYQIDASVNPGWSGGPIVDAQGRVIAVVAMKSNDEVANNIRRAMTRLDENYRADSRARMLGLTYGIPGATLARILKHPRLHDESRQKSANDRYAAKVLWERLDFLTGLTLLRCHLSAPLKVRMEAKDFEQGGGVAGKSRLSRMATAKVQFIELIPEEIVPELKTALRNKGIKEREKLYRDRLDERVKALQDSEILADEVKRDLQTLVRRIHEADAFAENPANSYTSFSMKVGGLSRDFKTILARLETALTEEE